MSEPGRMRKRGKTSAWLRSLLCHGLALSFLLGPSGCTRRFFRKRADVEVDETLAEKDKYPAWKIEQFHVYPDPRARFADPTDPDRPPMPPDDPAAHDLSPNPQKPGKCGIRQVEGSGYLELMKQWDAENRAEAAAAREQAASTAQTPAKPEEQKAGAGSTTALSTTPRPGQPLPYLLKLEQAVELGLINSREYQDARENLYLTALPVTLERFAFAAQFFAATEAIREWAGRRSSVGYQNNWTWPSNAGVAKLFSTGALLLFNFANQTVFNLAGSGRHVTSQSIINLDLVQPFLRGGGRAVTLEPLTQAERNLLYEIRSYARFRKTFYVAIAGGGGGSITGAEFQPTNVIAATTFSPNTGVTSAGLGPGVIPPVPVVGNPGLQVRPGPSGEITLQTALAAPVSGYLATLLQAAQMRVDEYNIEKLEAFLKLGKAMEEGGDISKLQVDQFEQAVLGGRTSLLTDQQQYLQSLDQFKLQLGLPTALPIELDDTPFRPLNQHFQRYEDLFNQFIAASEEPLRFNTVDWAPRVRREFRRILTTSPVVAGTRFRTEIQGRWDAWERLSDDELKKRLADYEEELRQLLGKKTDLENKGENLSADDQRRLALLESEIALGRFERLLRDYEKQPRPQQYRYLVNAFLPLLIEARNERLEQIGRSWPDLARLCVNGVDLIKADMDEAQAAVVQTAVANRLDLMNVRAGVVDAWRQVAIFANALLGTFNVQYHLDSTTPAGLAQPLAFRASRTRQELFFNAELPLVRKAERNSYRAALINYQRARRILMRAEDQVAFDVRGEIRQLRQQEENYRIQQRQVELGYLTVENSLDTFRAPLPTGQQADLATRAASLTNQLISAQRSLYTAQFAMTTIWITYLNTRLQLYRDMELMPLDYRGVWIDDVANCQCPDSDPGRLTRLGEPEFDIPACLPAVERDRRPQ
jgi:outer membrane protein TolC